MTDTLPPRREYPDEISLVDIAIIFIKRRYVFYAVFVAVTLAGLAYALLATEKYEYVSLIQVAQKDKGEPVQAVPVTIATLKSRWLPEVETAYRAEHNEKLPFKVVFSNPENTDLVRITSQVATPAAKIVAAAHQALINSVKEHQDELIKHEKGSVKNQIASLDNALDSLKGQQNSGEALAALIEKRAKLEGVAESLKSVDVLVTGRQSDERASPRRGLIVIFSVLLGGIMGVFMAFMSEFFVSVRTKLATNAT